MPLLSSWPPTKTSSLNASLFAVSCMNSEFANFTAGYTLFSLAARFGVNDARYDLNAGGEIIYDSSFSLDIHELTCVRD